MFTHRGAWPNRIGRQDMDKRSNGSSDQWDRLGVELDLLALALSLGVVRTVAVAR